MGRASKIHSLGNVPHLQDGRCSADWGGDAARGEGGGGRFASRALHTSAAPLYFASSSESRCSKIVFISSLTAGEKTPRPSFICDGLKAASLTVFLVLATGALRAVDAVAAFGRGVLGGCTALASLFCFCCAVSRVRAMLKGEGGGRVAQLGQVDRHRFFSRGAGVNVNCATRI